MCRIPDFGQSWRLLPVLLRTRRRRAVSDNISAFATPCGNRTTKTRFREADMEPSPLGEGDSPQNGDQSETKDTRPTEYSEWHLCPRPLFGELRGDLRSGSVPKVSL